MNTDRGRQPVELDHPMPIHLVYFTAYVEDDGTLVFYDDVYGHDEQLAQALGLSLER